METYFFSLQQPQASIFCTCSFLIRHLNKPLSVRSAYKLSSCFLLLRIVLLIRSFWYVFVSSFTHKTIFVPKCYNALRENSLFNINLTFLFLSLEGMKKGLFILCIVLFQVSFSQNNYVLAERYFNDGAFEKATVLFEELSKKNPNNTTYLKKLISSYQESGRFTTVTNLLKNKLSNHPNQSYLFVEIGYNYDRQHKKEEAIFYYDKAIAAIDQNPAMGLSLIHI